MDRQAKTTPSDVQALYDSQPTMSMEMDYIECIGVGVQRPPRDDSSDDDTNDAPPSHRAPSRHRAAQRTNADRGYALVPRNEEVNDPDYDEELEPAASPTRNRPGKLPSSDEDSMCAAQAQAARWAKDAVERKAAAKAKKQKGAPSKGRAAAADTVAATKSTDPPSSDEDSGILEEEAAGKEKKRKPSGRNTTGVATKKPTAKRAKKTDAEAAAAAEQHELAKAAMVAKKAEKARERKVKDDEKERQKMEKEAAKTEKAWEKDWKESGQRGKGYPVVYVLDKTAKKPQDRHTFPYLVAKDPRDVELIKQLLAWQPWNYKNGQDAVWKRIATDMNSQRILKVTMSLSF
jgi:hypothetical protein